MFMADRMKVFSITCYPEGLSVSDARGEGCDPWVKGVTEVLC